MSLNYVLRAKKFKTKKSLGQNFLIDENVIDFIADFAQSDDEILEIKYDNEKSTMDSLSRVSKMQSDHDVLMMNSISYSHGKYLLCLTVEDALMMGIPDVTYAKYAAIVSKHNNK